MRLVPEIEDEPDKDARTLLDSVFSERLSDPIYPTDVILLSGVYFLIKDGKVVYVGQSRCIPQRLESHARYGSVEGDCGRSNHEFDSAYYIKLSPLFLDDVEKALIKWFRPSCNRLKHPRGRALSLEEIKTMIDILGEQ